MIEVRAVSKTYEVRNKHTSSRSMILRFFKRDMKKIVALKEISFSIEEGEIVGYIGPNGAGKSTTIKILSGILVPDSGYCKINGFVPWKERKEYVRDIGVVFGQRTQLWWDIPVINSFDLIKDYYDVSANEYNERVNELIDMLDVKEIIYTPARQLSLGQRMRCEIIASLLHNPKILFLDEPTIGLDSPSKNAIRKFIIKINAERKTTVILTTHDMIDIEVLANRIILIGKGKVFFDGTLKELKLGYPHAKNLDELISECYKKYGI